MISSMDRVAPEKLAIHQPSMFLPWVKFEGHSDEKLPEVELLYTCLATMLTVVFCVGKSRMKSLDCRLLEIRRCDICSAS
jgi:hypothetical protein